MPGSLLLPSYSNYLGKFIQLVSHAWFGASWHGATKQMPPVIGTFQCSWKLWFCGSIYVNVRKWFPHDQGTQSPFALDPPVFSMANLMHQTNFCSWSPAMGGMCWPCVGLPQPLNGSAMAYCPPDGGHDDSVAEFPPESYCKGHSKRTNVQPVNQIYIQHFLMRQISKSQIIWNYVIYCYIIYCYINF